MSHYLVVVVIAVVVVATGFDIVVPGQTSVRQFFGRYIGTVRRPGIALVPPLTNGKKVSVKVHNFETSELKVNDLDGNPVNIAAIVVLASRREDNFNMRAAFLEVLNDALGSLGVIVAAIVIATTGFQQADALAGLFIAALIAPRALKLMAETTRVLMEFTPKGIDLDDVRAHILEMDRVHDVHDLHASTVATGLPIISAHIVVDDDCFQDGHAPTMLDDIRTCVATHFAISFEHSTFQLETSAQRHHEEALATHHP